MKKFIIGLVVGLALAGMFVVIAALAMAKFGDSKPPIAKDGTLILRLEGELPEKAGLDMGLPFLPQAPSVTVIDVWQGLKRAAVDPKIKAVVLMPRGMVVGWAKLQELRGDLLEF